MSPVCGMAHRRHRREPLPGLLVLIDPTFDVLHTARKCATDLTGSRPSLATHGRDWCSMALACDVFCHQQRYDAWVVSPAAAGGAPLVAPECPASGSPQSAPAAVCRHGPAGVESAVSRFRDHSGPRRHSPDEFLLACSSSSSYLGVSSPASGPRALDAMSLACRCDHAVMPRRLGPVSAPERPHRLRRPGGRERLDSEQGRECGRRCRP